MFENGYIQQHLDTKLFAQNENTIQEVLGKARQDSLDEDDTLKYIDYLQSEINKEHDDGNFWQMNFDQLLEQGVSTHAIADMSLDEH